jgi:hypothetical protein
MLNKIINKLIHIANSLDRASLHKEANIIDRIIAKTSEDDNIEDDDVEATYDKLKSIRLPSSTAVVNAIRKLNLPSDRRIKLTLAVSPDDWRIFIGKEKFDPLEEYVSEEINKNDLTKNKFINEFAKELSEKLKTKIDNGLASCRNELNHKKSKS